MTCTPHFEASELMQDLICITDSIVKNLQNTFPHKKMVQLLCEYRTRIVSDGRLIDAAVYDSGTVGDAISALYAHVDLITWLATHDYTVSKSSTR
jgi:hypothetical protein